jgi:hypothetical protein
MELWGIILAAVGVIVAIITLNKTVYSKSNEEKEQLLILIKGAQTLSIELQGKLEKLAAGKYSMDQDIFPGVTFGQYIRTLETTRAENLSDEKYEWVKNEKLSDAIIQSMTESVKTQMQALQSLVAEADMKLS